MVGLRASSSIDEQLVFNVLTGTLTAKLQLSTKLNAAFIDGMSEVWGLLKENRKSLQAIGDALMGETTLDRDHPDPLLTCIFEPDRDRATAFIAKLRAGPSRPLRAFSALTTFQRDAGIPWRLSDSPMFPPSSAGSARASSPRSSASAGSASST